MGYYNILFIGKSQDSNSCFLAHRKKHTPYPSPHTPLFYTYTEKQIRGLPLYWKVENTKSYKCIIYTLFYIPKNNNSTPHLKNIFFRMEKRLGGVILSTPPLIKKASPPIKKKWICKNEKLACYIFENQSVSEKMFLFGLVDEKMSLKCASHQSRSVIPPLS